MLRSKIGDFLKRERELILYGFFGVCSTVINIAAFHLCGVFGIALVPSNVIAWIFAFSFAFVTNKALVFQSRQWFGRDAFREFASFLAARVFTLALDTALMCVLVEWMRVDALVSKAAVNVIVILLNYLLSKFLIFCRR